MGGSNLEGASHPGWRQRLPVGVATCPGLGTFSFGSSARQTRKGRNDIHDEKKLNYAEPTSRLSHLAGNTGRSSWFPPFLCPLPFAHHPRPIAHSAHPPKDYLGPSELYRHSLGLSQHRLGSVAPRNHEGQQCAPTRRKKCHSQHVPIQRPNRHLGHRREFLDREDGFPQLLDELQQVG